MREAQIILGQVQKSKAIVTDGDRTLWKGNAAELGIGASYIIDAFLSRHLRTAASGVVGYFQVKRLARRNPEFGKDSPEALALFYRKLIQNRLGTRYDMERYARNHILGHMVDVTTEVLSSTQDRPKYLVSMNGSTIASTAKSLFRLTGTVSNTDRFDEIGRLQGVDLLLKNGEDKVRLVHDMLARLGIHLRECVVMGDDVADIPMLAEAGFPVASPFATPEVQRWAKYQIADKSLMLRSDALLRTH